MPPGVASVPRCSPGLERPLHSEGLAAAVSRICRRPRLTMLLSRRRGGPRLLRLSHADGMLVSCLRRRMKQARSKRMRHSKQVLRPQRVRQLKGGRGAAQKRH